MLKSLKISRSIALIAGAAVLIGLAALSAFSIVTMRDMATQATKAEIDAQLRDLSVLFRLTEDISKASTDQLMAAFASNFEGRFGRQTSVQLRIGEIQAPLLEHDGEALNMNFMAVDNFNRLTGGVATIFVRTADDDFARISTSLKREDGTTRAIGTLLGKQHPAYQLMIAGNDYVGVARLFGRDYMTKYQPIKNGDGEVIGILFVGFDLTITLADLRRAIGDIKSKQSGFAFAVYNAGARSGQIFAHPTAAIGSVLTELTDASGTAGALTPVLESESGQFRYTSLLNESAEVVQVDFLRGSNWGGLTYAVVSPVDEINATSNQVAVVLAIGGLGLAVVVILILTAFVRSTLHPLQALQQAMDRIGAGDLTARASVGDNGAATSNELILLSRGLDKTAANVSQLLLGVRQSAEQVRATSSTLNQIGAELVDSSEQGGMAVEHMESAIVEMAGSMESVGDNAEAARGRSLQANQVTQQSAVAIEQTVGSMQTLANSVQQSAEVITQLGEQSRRISAVTQIIREIAEQTNLLALNAAIEAARAGEQGRGFSVVADEVRKLAERTAQSTQEISSMLSAIQGGADQAIASMEKAVNQVQSGVTQVRDSGERMTQIRTDVQAAAEQVEAITHALREQAQARASIQDSAHRVSSLSSTNRQVSERSAQSARKMEQVAEELIRSVDRFKLN